MGDRSGAHLGDGAYLAISTSSMTEEKRAQIAEQNMTQAHGKTNPALICPTQKEPRKDHED